MTTLGDIIQAIFIRIAAIERRQDGQITQGTVEEVDPKAGTVRLKIGEDTDGKPFLTPPIPYAQFMGAMKVHMPPSKGQQMTALSGAGDFSQGLAVPMTQSDNNKSPSEKGDENVATFGSFKAEVRGDELIITVPRLRIVCEGTSFELSGAGLKATAPDYDWG